MTPRERFLRTMAFEPVDRIPYWEFGVLPGTMDRWYGEGFPRDTSIRDHFGLDPREGVGVNFSMCPTFEPEVLEEQGEYQVYRDILGNVQRHFKDGRAGMPEFLAHPIESRADFLELKKRYDPATPERYPVPWDEYVAKCRGRDYPLYLQAFRHVGFFGPLRNWMGAEALLLGFYDQPAWIHEMMEFVADYIVGIVERIGSDVQLDYVVFFEDIGYKTSSLISPAIFRDFMMGPYRRVTDAFRKHGCGVFFADSDGSNDDLIPLWIESGVNGYSPMEVQAEGMGPLELRARYPELLLYGGIDKRVFALDRRAVYDEVMGKVPTMIERGGYIPTVDHGVPPDASYDNYAYHWEILQAVCEGRSVPEPA